jgi:hypothetical protein
MIFLLLIFSGLCPETHSLFAKREAKTLIRLLKNPYTECRDGSLCRGCGGGATANSSLHRDYT